MSSTEKLEALLPESLTPPTRPADGPPGEAADWLKTVPAAPAVYALLDVDGNPVLLGSTANLRHAWARRLSTSSALAAPPRPDDRALTACVRYRRIGNAFAANWWYYRCARRLFPGRYRQMLLWKPAWFIWLDSQDIWPRWRIGPSAGRCHQACFGPLPGRACAQNLLTGLEDLFDLCRYYDILRQAPQASACPYKDMGKCPAPCDGSISRDAYLEQLRRTAEFLSSFTFQFAGQAGAAGVESTRHDLTAAMRSAAATIDFHLAGRLKAKLTRLEELTGADFRHLNRLDRCRYLVLQKGFTARWIEPFLVLPQRIEVGPAVKRAALAEASESWWQWIQHQRTTASGPAQAYETPASWPVEEVLGLLAWHLFRTRDPGCYVPLWGIDSAASLAEAVRGWRPGETTGYKAVT